MPNSLMATAMARAKQNGERVSPRTAILVIAGMSLALWSGIAAAIFRIF
jgi:uncharacterized protein involved in exopolysaccharide biosynthesis